MEKYQARQLQIVLFTPDGSTIGAVDLWRLLAKSTEPSIIQTTQHGAGSVHPLIGTLVSGKVDVAQGPFFEDTQITCSVQSSRADIIIAPNNTSATLQAPVLKDYKTVANKLIKTFDGALPKIKALTRVATVVTFVRQIQDERHTTSEVFRFLGVETSPDGLSDINFTINKRGTLCDGVEVNRVMHWQTEQFMSLDVSAGVAKVIPSSFLSLSIDVNSLPEKKLASPVKSELFVSMLDEIGRLSDNARIGSLDG